MSELSSSAGFPHLPGLASRAASTIARPKSLALICIAVLAGAGWLQLGLLSGTSGWIEALCAPQASGIASVRDALLVASMWAAMTLAMMLPGAAPMILTYAEIAETAARKRIAVATPLALIAGYCAVWLGFALAAAALQIALAAAGRDAMAPASAPISSALFLLAGLYQFSALKHACLAKCRRPFAFFFTNWKTNARDVFGLGLRQGLHCLGCCWAMMLLMFALGTMNVVWMAALGMLMAAEKLTATSLLSRVLGAAFIAVGAGLALSAFGMTGTE